MSLQARVEADLKQAMRAGDAVARDTLRMVLSELKGKQIEIGRDLTPDEEQAVCLRAVKTRQESVEQFDKAGRSDLAAKERAEIRVVQAYLPRMMSEEETRAAVKAVLAELGAVSKKELGVVMKAVMARHKGQVEGRLAQKILGEILA